MAGRLAAWSAEDVQRHKGLWERHAATCEKLHEGCDCNRLYRQLIADADSELKSRPLPPPPSDTQQPVSQSPPDKPSDTPDTLRQ